MCIFFPKIWKNAFVGDFIKFFNQCVRYAMHPFSSWKKDRLMLIPMLMLFHAKSLPPHLPSIPPFPIHTNDLGRRGLLRNSNILREKRQNRPMRDSIQTRQTRGNDRIPRRHVRGNVYVVRDVVVGV
jgi:hypothetical protein